MVTCEKCGTQNDNSRYYCISCGSLLNLSQVADQKKYEESQRKIARIIQNLEKNPHHEIVWNHTVDAYEKRVERIESLLRLSDVKVSNNELREKISHFLKMCRKPDFQIAFVGTIKTGKSTLINALLGHEYASMAVTPETAALTKFRSSEKDFVRVSFYDQTEWNALWSSATKDAGMFMEKYKKLHADEEKDKWIGHQGLYKEVANEDVDKELAKWSSSQKAVHYFVKEIEVGISSLGKDFPPQIVFVDTPGLFDPMEYRSQISRKYIHEANAVFVCVEASKMNREEILTIEQVFSNSSHNKDKVHVVATQWDKFNDPKSDWDQQYEYMIEQLTGKGFFDKKEDARKNITYSAAYIYNLCKKYDLLERKEKIIISTLPMKLDLDMDITELTDDDLKKIMEITNIGNINEIIRNELVDNFSKLLFEDIEHLYIDILYTVKRLSKEQKKDLEERIQMTNASMDELDQKVQTKKEDFENIKKSQDQLKAAMNALGKHQQQRLNAIMEHIDNISKNTKVKKS